jgi:hypothetical protein
VNLTKDNVWLDLKTEAEPNATWPVTFKFVLRKTERSAPYDLTIALTPDEIKKIARFAEDIDANAVKESQRLLKSVSAQLEKALKKIADEEID